MQRRGTSWEGNRRELARVRRQLRRRIRKDARRLPPEPVEVSRSRRAARRGFAVVLLVWAAAIVTVVLLIRTRVLASADVGFSFVAGCVAGGALLAIWFGYGVTPHLASGAGVELVTARTVVGARTLDLSGLIAVRRLEAVSRGSDVDELYLRDANGVRLVIGMEPGVAEVEAAILRSIEADSVRSSGPSIKVTKHARRRLGLAPEAPLLARIGHHAIGFALLLAPLLLAAGGSLALAAMLAR